MHACASFKIEDFNKDCHLLGDHASALRLINRFAVKISDFKSMHVTGFEPVMFY